MSTQNWAKVQRFIEDIQALSASKYLLLMALRDLVKSSGPKLIEEIKYGGLVYLLNSELRCGIFVYKNHLSLEFSRGAELPDPGKLLEGKGQFRRHIKLVQLSDIQSRRVAEFLNAALNQS
jgi:hypothetical protein